MSSFDEALAVLQNNRADVLALAERFGGIAGLIDAAPSIIRIAVTLSKQAPAADEAQQIAQTMLYSAQTKERVAEFQKKHGLTADGLVGDQTWTEVEKLIGNG